MTNLSFDISASQKITFHSDQIMQRLVSSSQPADAIFQLYDKAEDKDAFVAGLIGNLILRHKQWQGGQTP
jgi:hypothetical protein